MGTYKARIGQSLWDVAISVYGDVAGVVWLLEDNPQLSGPVHSLLDGEVLAIRTQVLNRRVVEYLADYPRIGTLEEPDMAMGVGFWGLEQYIVQG